MKAYFKNLLVCLLVLPLMTAQVFSQQLHPAEAAQAARTVESKFQTTIYFYNDTQGIIKLYWLNQNGTRAFVIALDAGQSTTATTYVSQPWVVTDDRENALGLYYPDAQPRTIRIGNQEQITVANVAPVISNLPPREADGNYNNSNRSRDDEDYYDSFRDSRLKYDETPITICRDQKIPRGFLITKAGSDFNCPGWNAVGSNTYTIQRPSLTNPTLVCGNQEIPRGFVIARASNDFNCPNWNAVNTNAYVIKRPADSDTICSVSAVPRNFVVTGEYNDFNCPNWNAVNSNAKKIRRVR